MSEGPPPKFKADFAKLLDDAGVVYSKKACLADLKQLCIDNHLVAAPPVVAPSDVASTSAPSGPPKLKSDFAKLLDAASIPYPKKGTIDDFKKLCVDNGIIAAEPPKPPTPLQRLTLLLKSAGVEIPEGATLPDLSRLAFELGIESKEVEEITTVKCCIHKCMKKAMTVAQYEAFSVHVEAFVNIISRMTRRATLALSYHMTRLVREGRPLPDLYKQKDTYWRSWLRLGAYMPEPHDVRVVDDHRGDGQACTSLERSLERMLPVLDRVYADTIDFWAAQPAHFDQVLTYAAHTLETIVCNNAWVPLWARLKRLTGLHIREWRNTVPADFKLYDDRVMTAIRSADPQIAGWPQVVVEWVNDVRSRLRAADKPLFDDHGKKKMTFSEVFRFNYWMQCQFRALDVRCMRLMPVTAVGRMHVRLDTRVLVNLFRDALGGDHESLVAIKGLKKTYTDASGEHKGAAADPDTFMLPPAIPEPNRDKCTLADWDAHVAAVAAQAEEVERIKVSAAYIDLRAKYDELHDAERAFISGFFPGAPKRAGWKFSGSVATDGVAISLQYSRKVRCAVYKKAKAKPMKRRAKKKVAEPEPAADDAEPGVPGMDHEMSTIVGDTVVLGLDPGRSNLAVISYVYININGKQKTGKRKKKNWARSRGDCPTNKHETGKRKKRSWTLSRGEYQTKSGIIEAQKRKLRMLAELRPSFATLALPGSCLSACHEDEVFAYCTAYREFSEAWWSVALRRVNSRLDMQLYMGKRRVLDGFFSRVKRGVMAHMKADFPHVTKIDLAYGEAGLTMSPTGRGEVAVPTGGTFKACKRVFTGPDCKVSVVDESFTTKVSSDTGGVKELVYRCLAADNTVIVGHCPGKDPPTVPMAIRPQYEVVRESTKRKNKARRGGTNFTQPQYINANPFVPTRYIEVRSLRFCPELRKYVDRDTESSITIAKLRVLEILGIPRPQVFCRGDAV